MPRASFAAPRVAFAHTRVVALHTRAEAACTQLEVPRTHLQAVRTSLAAACADGDDAHSPIDFVGTHFAFARPLGARGLPHLTNLRAHVARCVTAIAFATPHLPLPQQSAVCAKVAGTTRVPPCRSRTLGFRSGDSSSRSRQLTPRAARLARRACHRRPRAALLTSRTRCLTTRSPEVRCPRCEHTWQSMGAHVARRVSTPEEWRLLASATDHLMSDTRVLTCRTPRLECRTLDG